MIEVFRCDECSGILLKQPEVSTVLNRLAADAYSPAGIVGVHMSSARVSQARVYSGLKMLRALAWAIVETRKGHPVWFCFDRCSITTLAMHNV